MQVVYQFMFFIFGAWLFIVGVAATVGGLIGIVDDCDPFFARGFTAISGLFFGGTGANLMVVASAELDMPMLDMDGFLILFGVIVGAVLLGWLVALFVAHLRDKRIAERDEHGVMN